MGMTVGDLRQRMSREELNVWVAYVAENGPLNLALRIEGAVARALSAFAKNTTPKDFMVWPIEAEPVATPEAAFALFKGLASRSKQRSN
jgi:hypothetical protein